MKGLLTWSLLLTVFAVIVGCGKCSTSTVQSVPASTIAELEQRVTVALYINDHDGDAMAYCAGTWVDKTHILTADHCVEQNDIPAKLKEIQSLLVPRNSLGKELLYSVIGDYDTDAWVKAITIPPRKATVVDVDADNDLALLEVEKDPPIHPWAHLSKKPINVGDSISTVGHTQAFTWTYSRGYVSTVRNHMVTPSSAHVKVIQASLPLWFGNSGGGIFNADGELIGVASFIVEKGPNMGFCIHRDVIAGFLGKHNLTHP